MLCEYFIIIISFGCYFVFVLLGVYISVTLGHFSSWWCENAFFLCEGVWHSTVQVLAVLRILCTGCFATDTTQLCWEDHQTWIWADWWCKIFFYLNTQHCWPAAALSVACLPIHLSVACLFICCLLVCSSVACLSVHLLFVCLSVAFLSVLPLPVHPSVASLSIYLACLSTGPWSIACVNVCLFVACLSVASLPVHLFSYLSLCPSVACCLTLSVCLEYEHTDDAVHSVTPPVPSFCLFLCPSVYLSLTLCIHTDWFLTCSFCQSTSVAQAAVCICICSSSVFACAQSVCVSVACLCLSVCCLLTCFVYCLPVCLSVASLSVCCLFSCFPFV